MGYTIYFQAHENGDTQQIAVDKIRHCFDPYIVDSDESGFYLSYGPEEACHIAIAAEETYCSDFSVRQPCGDLRLFESMFHAGRTGNFVCMLPEGRFIVFDGQTVGHLPESITDDHLHFEIAETVQAFLELMHMA